MRAALVLLLAIAATFVQVPAHANVTATISDSEHQAFGGCARYDFRYDLNLPANATGWQAAVTADNDYGGVEHILASSRGDAVEGYLETPRFCEWEEPVGRYSITVEGTYTTATSTGVISGSGYLTLRPARTRTTITASPLAPRFNQPVRVTAEVQVKKEFGWGPVWAADVKTQIRLRGRWVNAPKLALVTGRNGRDNFFGRWNIRGAVTLRFFMPKQDMYAKSVSKPITIRTR